MKNKITLSLAALAAVLVSGCATSAPKGSLLTDITLPLGVTSNSRKVEATKVGKAQCKDYFGLIAIGDASINAAMRDGNIKTVYYVDWKAENVLGITGTYECTVYGE